MTMYHTPYEHWRADADDCVANLATECQPVAGSLLQALSVLDRIRLAMAGAEALRVRLDELASQASYSQREAELASAAEDAADMLAAVAEALAEAYGEGDHGPGGERVTVKRADIDDLTRARLNREDPSWAENMARAVDLLAANQKTIRRGDDHGE